MTPIGALIQECIDTFLDRERVTLTYGDIARRSHGALTRTRVQQLAKNPIRDLPAPEKLHGLAAGLGVPYSVVLQRALESAGYLTAPIGYAEEPLLDPPMTFEQVEAENRALIAMHAQAVKGGASPDVRPPT